MAKDVKAKDVKAKIETRATQVEHGWQDHDGFIGPYQPGNGPRSDPAGNFPTGPAIGELFPDVISTTADQTPFDLHQQRAGQAAIFVLFRSAVW